MIRNIKRYDADFSTSTLIINRETSSELKRLWWAFKVWLA